MADADVPVQASDRIAARRDLSRALLLCALLGLAARLAFGLLYWVDQPLTRDEHEYLSLARSVAAGRGFVYDDEGGPADPFGRAPGYPAWLAVAGGAAPAPTSVPVVVKITQSFLGALGVVFVGLIAWRMAGDRAARLAALIAALYPPLIWVSAYALSEALFWPLGLGVVLLFDVALASARPARHGLLCGLLAGVGVLVRPQLLFFLLLAGLWLVARRRLALVTALAAGSLLVVAPWTVRNYEHHGRFVLVASEGGVTFWTGNHPLAIGDGDLAANPAIKADQLALRARYPELSEEAMEPIYYREAFAWIRANPVDWAVLELRKLFYLIVPAGPSYTVHSPLYVGASLVSYGLLLPVAMAGLVRLGRRRRRTAGLWLLVGSAVLVALVFFPQERFRIPVIDPALAISAGALAAPRREPDA